MKKITAIYRVLLGCILTLGTQLYAQICGSCGLSEPSTITAEEIANPVSVAYSPNGNCLAVVNNSSDTVSIFSVDPQTCTLTPDVSGSPFSTGDISPGAAVYSPNGRCLIVTNAGNIPNPAANPGSISVFSVGEETDPESCALQLTQTIEYGVDITGVSTPALLAFSPNMLPNGNYCLAVVNQSSNNVSVFSLDPDLCELTHVDTYDTGPTPLAVQYSPSGNCLIVSNLNASSVNNGSITIFRVADPMASCTLELVDTVDSNGRLPSSVTYFNNGQCLAVVNSNILNTQVGKTNISLFAVGQDAEEPCGLTLVNTIPLDDASGPFAGALSPNGSCFAVANLFDNTVTTYAVSATECQLTQADGPITVGSFPRSLTYSPNNKCLVVANGGFNPIGGTPDPEIELGSVSLFSTNFVTAPTLSVAINCAEVTLTGTADLNTQVTLFQDDVPVGTVPVDGSGNFIFNLTLPTGTYTFTAQATSALGCTSVLSIPVVADVSVITIRQVFSTCLSPTSVYGASAQPGATVRLYVDDTLIAASTADSEGNFYMVNLPVSIGNHCFVAEDVSTGCISSPVCAEIRIVPTCHLISPNLSFSTHCPRLR